MSVGVQKARYHKQTLVPGEAPSVLGQIALASDRFGHGLCDGNGGGLWRLHPGAGGQRHLAQQCRQQQPGASRHHLAPGRRRRALDVHARGQSGRHVFDIKKPYFNLDPSNVYRELGGLENKGLEMSLSGNITDRLDLVAGGVLAQPSVNGDAVKLGIAGDKPVGLYSRKFILGANWRPPGTDGLSFDMNYNHYGSRPSTLDNVVSVPAHSTLDWDTRYEFRMAGENASLKFAVMNLFNSRSFGVFDAGTYGFFFGNGRRIDLRLIVDV